MPGSSSLIQANRSKLAGVQQDVPQQPARMVRARELHSDSPLGSTLRMTNDTNGPWQSM